MGWDLCRHWRVMVTAPVFEVERERGRSVGAGLLPVGAGSPRHDASKSPNTVMENEGFLGARRVIAPPFLLGRSSPIRCSRAPTAGGAPRASRSRSAG